ncbi:hypothetical protein [Micromonospora sp. D93]|uniref:hypothetical protein n=1 Tax=Micromonospora sp. D93 TaxID=2824886 RepID=UPI001FFDE208|nr:hypothetical protein [Micromonospora sp. D93]
MTTDGVHHTADLHTEILACGQQGSLRALKDWFTTNLADARNRCPNLDTVADLARRFTALVRHQGTGQRSTPGFTAPDTTRRMAVHPSADAAGVQTSVAGPTASEHPPSDHSPSTYTKKAPNPV